MNILIDARVGQFPNIGVGVYVNSLVGALERIVGPGDKIDILLFSGKKVHPVIEQCKNVNLHFLRYGLEWSPQKAICDEVQINSVIGKNSIDIFHCPTFLQIRNVRCHSIVTAMDLYMFGRWHGLSFPKKLWWQYLMRRSVNKADAIITISDYTRDLIHRRFGISMEKLRTIYPGPGYVNNETPLTSEIHEEDVRKYILFVGAPKPNKNLGCLIEAFKAIAEPLSREYELLLIGPKPTKANDFFDILESLKSDRINWIDAVSDVQLREAYEKAQLFVHPSFVEGFGLPLVEAMSCGLPIVASDIPINHEIAGDAVIYFNPYSSNDLRQRIEEVLADPGLRNSLSKRSLERALRYSWDACARQHYTAYRAVLEVT